MLQTSITTLYIFPTSSFHFIIFIFPPPGTFPATIFRFLHTLAFSPHSLPLESFLCTFFSITILLLSLSSFLSLTCLSITQLTFHLIVSSSPCWISACHYFSLLLHLLTISFSSPLTDSETTRTSFFRSATLKLTNGRDLLPTHNGAAPTHTVDETTVAEVSRASLCREEVVKVETKLWNGNVVLMLAVMAG